MEASELLSCSVGVNRLVCGTRQSAAIIASDVFFQMFSWQTGGLIEGSQHLILREHHVTVNRISSLYNGGQLMWSS